MKNKHCLTGFPKECEFGRDLFGKAPPVTSHSGPPLPPGFLVTSSRPLSCSPCPAEMWVSSPVFCFSRPLWAIRGPRPVPPGGCGQDLLYGWFLFAGSGASSRFPNQTAVDSGFWNHQARLPAPAQRTRVGRGCTQRAVGLLGGGLPKPHRRWPLKSAHPLGAHDLHGQCGWRCLSCWPFASEV